MGAIASNSSDINKIGVLGAGIMGGGISYQSALKGKNVAMKDVAQEGLDAGMQEASKLLSKRVDRGRMSVEKMAGVLSSITPTLHYSEFANAEIVVEAVVENPKVKALVHKETESQVPSDCIIASNTSTILISQMAGELQRPENFCGMHFFNPVHRMPLVEVIRGKQSSERTIGAVVKLAQEMGKTPIVVNDCAGFFVNRVLFPYLAGLNLLIRDGIDFRRVDKVMEKFGWPMGPAYLIDVVGLDTACHASSVMAQAYPDRMSSEEKAAVNILHNYGRDGQKNLKGFYRYEIDKKGKPKKIDDADVDSLIKPVVLKNETLSDEEIIDRMMIPMCLEVVRCLDEGIVENVIDAELGLLMGVGFPLFRGGPIRYMESIGLQEFIDKTEHYHHLGELYRAPMSLMNRASTNQSYFAE
jgi:3-hydroxyacyl-CoA dehydrogenase/enoyl-CoA hydratase/3-hydroxybutyryl-CoA epimerase/enoyl-CoA isomerase